jgi:neutral ceramidase
MNKLSFITTIIILASACGAPIAVQETITDTAFGLTSMPESPSDFLVGVGKGDTTSSVNAIPLMGFAAPSPKANGLHTRLYARAFVIAPTHMPQNRVALIHVDTCFIPQSVHQEVLRQLEHRFPGFYNDHNVMITASHTHSAPGGHSHYHFYGIPAGGYAPEVFNATVLGIVESLSEAHHNLKPSQILINKADLLGASINRSLDAYMLNPLAERQRYATSIDPEMTLLRFKGEEQDLGLLNWFSVHATSMKKRSNLISADNKGYASYLFERKMRQKIDHGPGFVAAFANGAAGDLSPNVDKDVDGRGEWKCKAIDPFKCTQESAEKQFNFAEDLFDSATDSLTPLVDARLAYVDFSSQRIRPEFLSPYDITDSTCSAAIGLSMLAGSPTDGPGVGRVGISCGSGAPLSLPLCVGYRRSCQGVKPVVLNLDKRPFPWTPEVLPIQIIRIGQLAILGVPAELTTMAGRRLKSRLLEDLAPLGVEHVVIAGYANAYSGYVTTKEEYAKQNYEGASTHFGPHTLSAYIQNFADLAASLNQPTMSQEMLLRPRTLSPVPKQAGEQGLDRLPRGIAYGQSIVPPKSGYKKSEKVRVEFYASRLNHQPRRLKSYFEVQRWHEGSWQPVAYDHDVSTRLMWQRNLRGISTVAIEWYPEPSVPAGTYRIHFQAEAMPTHGKLLPYSYTSASFVL